MWLASFLEKDKVFLIRREIWCLVQLNRVSQIGRVAALETSPWATFRDVRLQGGYSPATLPYMSSPFSQAPTTRFHFGG